MPPLPRGPFRLDLWSAPAPAGGTRVAFLAEPGASRAVLTATRSRFLEQGQSRLTFTVAPTHHALASLTPQQAILRLTRAVPTTPDTFDEIWEEWRVVQRRRPVKRAAAPYEIVCVPLEDDLLDADLYREVTSGGLSSWGYRGTDRTPAQVLGDVAARLAALGHTWVTVGTVTPTTPVTIVVEGTASPRAIVTALVEALAAKGVASEFEFVRAPDNLSYQLQLLTRVAGALAPLIATTDAAAIDVTVDEDAAEQVNAVIPFSEDGVDLRELQVEVQAVDAGTGWVTLRAIGAAPAAIVGVDDQWNGRRLFRELTGRSFAILDSTASPMRVQLAVADLASNLAVGERVSFRESETFTGTRRAFGTRAARSPLEVVSTLTGPPRINTNDRFGGGVTIHVANQYRDWEVQRSTLVAVMPDATFDPGAGTVVFASTPSTAPQANDWLWSNVSGGVVPLTVTAYNAGTRTATVVARYVGDQFTVAATYVSPTVRCYRPAGTPMWIQASAVSGNQLTVDAFSGGTPSATDVLELLQRHQGERLVEVRDPVAITATRRRVGTLQVACTGATNRCGNGDLNAWAGASGDPPDGWVIDSIVGTVTRTRTTDPTETRYGGKGWKLAFAAGASAVIRSPLIPVHGVPGMMQVSAALALLFKQFSGGIPFEISVVSVHASGTRTVLGRAFNVFPPDTAAAVDDAQKAALDAWYDAQFTQLSLEGLGDEALQLTLRRPPGASNPACTLVLDAAMLLQRDSLPQAAEGGVRYVFQSDATPMLQAAQDLLRDRARPLLRFEGRMLDLYRLDGLRYAPFELVPGRDVDLRIPALGLQRTVRLMGLSENLDDPRVTQVVLDRVRPDVGRLLASKFANPIPVSSETPVAAPGTPYANVQVARIAVSPTQVTILGTATCPGLTPPQIRVASLGGGITIATGPSVGTPASSGQSWVINRNANGSGPGIVVIETVGAGFIADSKVMVIEEQGVELLATQLRLRVLSSTDTHVTLRAAVADALPQGPNSATITLQTNGLGTVSPAGPVTVTPAATLTEAAGTYQDFVVPKPAAGAGAGHLTATVTAANRLVAADIQVIPPQTDAHVSIAASFAEDGAATVRLTGSPSVASMRYAVSTSAMPSLATVQAATPVNGRNLSVALAGPYALGQTLYISVLAYPQTGGAGAEFGPFESTATRFDVAGTKTIRMPAQGTLIPYDNSFSRTQYTGYFSTPPLKGWHCIIPVPKGATLTAVRVRVRGYTSPGGKSSRWNLYLHRVGQSGSATQIATGASAVHNTTWETIALTSLSESTAGDRAYELVCTSGIDIVIFPDPPPADPEIAWIEYDLDFPDVTVNT